MPRFFKFVGKKITLFLALGLVVGLLFFVVEIVFASAIQSFLSEMGLGSQNLTPGLIPNLDLPTVMLLLVTLGVLRALLQWAQHNLTYSTWGHFSFRMRSSILDWIYSSPSSNTAEVITLYNDRTNDSTICITEIQSSIFYFIVTLLLLGNLFWRLPKATALALVFLSLIFLPLRIANKRVHRLGRNLVEFWNKANERMVLGIRNLLLLRLYNLADEEKNQSRKNLESYRRAWLKSYSAIGFTSALPQSIGVAVLCLVIYFERKSSAESPQLLVGYFYIFYRFVQSAAQGAQAFARASSYWPRLAVLQEWWFSNIDIKTKDDSRSAEQKIFTKTNVGSIGWKFQNASFSYDIQQPPVLKNLNFYIHPLSCFGIRGASGRGKTTLLNLLLGQLTGAIGKLEVEIDGKNFEIATAKDVLLPNIGYVGPESFIIDGTILENLKYGANESFSETEALDALKVAHCDFLIEKSQPLAFRITEQGQGLSAGQKQRLALAKALLRKPKALILDEATSNLDSKTEAEILDTLKKLKGKMTVVIVSHRETLFEIADQVIDL